MDRLSHLSLKYGKKEIDLTLPPNSQIVKPNDLPGQDGEVEIKRGLMSPLGSKKLSELVPPHGKTAIIVSDITRPTPTSKLLPPLLEELNKGGVSSEDVVVVFATGLHRKLIEAERKSLVGDVYDQIKCINHDADDCIYVGSTRSGTKVSILRDVFDADVVICLGTIELHYFAGYSGGAKSILPGVSSRETIEMNHKLMLLPNAASGCADSPVRKDMEEAGAMLGIDFILNVVLNTKREIVRAVAGHPVHAHRAGAIYADQIYRVPIKERADIVIASSGGAPKDLNVYQAYKALDNAKHAVSRDGSIILVAECPEGMGSAVLESWVREANSPREVIDRLERNFKLGGHMAAAIARIAEKHDIYILSELPDHLAEKSFFIPVKDVGVALEAAMKKHGDAKIIVMPYGNSTLPFT
ncbi:MAG: nickel-dependent lactate racemase [Methanocellales archaeon]|nr:nickel-dependent lactate racemase [Methanocellales archaeon]MDD3291326.1 nickel-dependent lactate racemase [Methanocellales archaeon]MDD5235820.1 nickel-dependent lactate racemase [Methanocellales archaeon]MDD5484419.1 nickel-dependent lactate racemase [Methanocellales archaeon]